MSTHSIQFHDKITKFPLVFVFSSYRKNFKGTQNEFELTGKRVIGVRAVEVRLTVLLFLLLVNQSTDSNGGSIVS